MKPTIPTEAQEQAALFRWAKCMAWKWTELRCMHHIPNGGSRNPIEARHLKEQGVKAGIPDIFLPCARGGWHGLYIEMKRRTGGRISEEQRAMLDALRAQGYRTQVCKGWEQAKQIIEQYLREEK